MEFLQNVENAFEEVYTNCVNDPFPISTKHEYYDEAVRVMHLAQMLARDEEESIIIDSMWKWYEAKIKKVLNM